MPRKYYYYAAAILLIACWNAVGFHQGDEHFQILEFAAAKVGFINPADLPWEYAEQMRPATQPAAVYLLYKVWSVFGEVNPFYFAFFLRLLSATAFVALATALFWRFHHLLPSDRLVRWLALGLLFNWCSIYSGIRFSSENWSGMAVAAGFLLYPLTNPQNTSNIYTPENRGNTWLALATGLLFGLAFLLRYQVALLVVGFLAWLLFIGREQWSKLALVIIGGLLMVGLGTLIDRWFYGEWVIAPWNYLRANLIEGKAATFGTAPWWDYFESVVVKGVPPISLLYLVAPLWFLWRYRRDPLSWMLLPFLLVHFYLSRKDVRFLFPLLPYLPVTILAGAAALREHYGTNFFDRKWVRRGVRFFWGINLILVASVMVRPAVSEVKNSKFLYDNYAEPITLLADGKHIYTYSNLIVRFYQRPGRVSIVESADRSAWPADCPTAVCLYTEHTKTPNPPAGAKLVYTDRPAIGDQLGLGKLMDGTRWWYIYELTDR